MFERHACDIAAKVTVAGRTFDVRLADVSGAGCRVEGRFQAPPGTPVSVAVAGFGEPLSGRVARSDEDGAGISLSQSEAVQRVCRAIIAAQPKAA
jgi:hypothetical protein